VFHASAGLSSPNVAAELDAVPASDTLLEYLYSYHNDNCLCGVDVAREYLMSLQENKLVHPGELDGLRCVNQISTAGFRGHGRKDLLLVDCGSECFLYFASKPWNSWLSAESTVLKLL